jgi:hypothetical protein
MIETVSPAKSRRGSDEVRQFAAREYVAPARRRGEQTLKINAGEVHRATAMHNRVPLVCQALESNKFLEENGLRLLSKSGPPSGRSTTVTYTYEFIEGEKPSRDQVEDAWQKMRGAFKDVFAAYGGADEFLRRERENFYAPDSTSPGNRE